MDKSELRKRRNAIAVIILVAIPLLLAGLWFINKIRPVKTIEKRASSVITVSPQKESVEEELVFNGYLEPYQSVTILPKVSGQLMELLVSRGEQVEKGQLLAIVDPKPYELALTQAEAAYIPTKSIYKRVSSMYESGGISLQSFEEARAQYEAAKAQYESAKLQLEYTRVKSPIAGTILETHSDPGNLVSSAVPLLTVADMKDLYVRVSLPERYYSLFSSLKESEEGIKAYLQYNKEGDNYPLIIENLSPYIQGRTGSFEVLCRLDSPPASLTSGFAVDVSFQIAYYENVWTVPRSVLTQDSSLWIVQRDSQTAKRMDGTSLLQTSDRLIIPGDWSDLLVISKGQHFLKEGDSVSILSRENS